MSGGLARGEGQPCDERDAGNADGGSHDASVRGDRDRDCTKLPRRRIVRRVLQVLPMTTQTWNAVLAIALPCVGAIAATLVLRAARFSLGEIGCRAVVAGTIAGLLLGPSVLGRAFPEQFESIFLGGVKEREAFDYARWLAANAPAAALSLTEEGRAALIDQGRRDIAVKEAALNAARWAHQCPLRTSALIVVGLMLLASSSRYVGARDRRQGWITPVSIGLWSFALPAAAAYLCAVRFWNVSVGEAALLAAAVAIGPWALGPVERDAADGAEFGGARMMQTAGQIASTLAIALAVWAAWRVRGVAGLIMFAPLAALPVAWLIPFMRAGHKDAKASTHDDAAGVKTLVVELLIALVTTLVAMRIDLHAPWSWAVLGALVALPLMADDGRWLGAFLGAMLPGGRPGLRTMRLVMPAMAAGPTQLAVAALAFQGGLVPERFALPLLAGVMLIEITAPARRHMAAGLIETEQEIDEAE